MRTVVPDASVLLAFYLLDIVRALIALRVETAPVDGTEEETLRTAVRHERSAYDAAYLAPVGGTGGRW